MYKFILLMVLNLNGWDVGFCDMEGEGRGERSGKW